MVGEKSYRVERALGAGDKVPAWMANIYGHLEVGDVVTTPLLYEKFGGRLCESTTKATTMTKFRRAMLYGVRHDLVANVASKSERPYRDFLDMPAIKLWVGMLNPPNVLHPTSRMTGTRHIYGYAMYRFHRWLAGGKKWSIASRTAGKNSTYKEVRGDVEIRGVDHLLVLAGEKGAIDRDLAAVIRRFFADLNAQKKYSRSVMLQTQSALKSFFMSHEIQYGIQLPRYMLRGTGSGGAASGNSRDVWENRDLKMSDFSRMLTVGKPTIRDKAVLLAKFHRGLDLVTLTDLFNYTAFDQMAAHMGTDDPELWDLDKCPVPVTVTRVKTDFKHVGFLERDAVAANVEWIKERRRLTGKALRRGDDQPLYITQHGKPIGPAWVGSRFRLLAVRAGLCTKRNGGGLSSTRHSHQLRHLLKSTLIDAGCRIDIADHVIGHSPKDAYEKQAALYPDSLRLEYAKASGKINIFTNFETSIDGGDDIHQLRAKVEADQRRLKEVLAAAEAERMRAEAGRNGSGSGKDKGEGWGNGNDIEMAKILDALRQDVRKLQAERAARDNGALAGGGNGGGGGGKGSAATGGGPREIEYQCAGCSLIHSSMACPDCGSTMRRVYGGDGGGGGKK